MELTREKALELHRKMWTDMQKKLGNYSGWIERMNFKEDWCAEHFPDEYILHSCFLCEYARQFEEDDWGKDCRKCPVVWPSELFDGCDYNAPCEGRYVGDRTYGYKYIPISKLLALPEREETDGV